MDAANSPSGNTEKGILHRKEEKPWQSWEKKVNYVYKAKKQTEGNCGKEL